MHCNAETAQRLAAFLEERRDLGKELSRLTAQLRRMMDLAQRREDGLRRLEEARG